MNTWIENLTNTNITFFTLPNVIVLNIFCVQIKSNHLREIQIVFCAYQVVVVYYVTFVSLFLFKNAW